MLEVGQFIPQGDLALKKLKEVPQNARLVKNPSSQVAGGTTQGSRHIWDSMDGINVYDIEKNELTGFVYELTKERTLTHPEHAHHTYHAGYIGQIIYQRSASQELRKIAD